MTLLGLASAFLLAQPQSARAGGLHESIFLFATGMGGLATYLAETKTPDSDKLNFFTVQGEYYYGLRSMSVLSQGFGVERRLAPWFAIGLEITVQEMLAANYGALGMSLNPQFKWFLFGEARLSLFLAYTSGLHYATDVFPQGGAQFTFRLITALGLEYKTSQAKRARVTLGHLHQSNNNLLPVNPGYDGFGLAISYLWEW